MFPQTTYSGDVIIVAIQPGKILIKDIREGVEDWVLPIGLVLQRAQGTGHVHRAVVYQVLSLDAAIGGKALKALGSQHRSPFLQRQGSSPRVSLHTLSAAHLTLLSYTLEMHLSKRKTSNLSDVLKHEDGHG